MATFAKFILLDSGRPVLINPHFVEQVRDGSEPGTTAVYFTGRSGPIGLQAKVDAVMRELAGSPPAPTLVSAASPTKAKPAKVVDMASKTKSAAR